MSGLLEDGFHGDGPVAGINVTPLVDVMLCLLVIFMVSTPLMAPEAPMQISIPKAVGSPVAEEQFLLSTISIDAKGGVFLGTVGLSSDPNTLGAELGSNAKLKEAGMVFIQGDENLAFDRVVDVLVALRTAGVSKVGFLTDPRGEKKKT
ncbi:biopolymer transporter ExbD [Nannocystis sp.]|uniref:ExbD/TolR family protein n=1 Tax=Nannocystis sp. TaxID=1962667 RepID=UPI0025D23343|nr:biopolymer transporter ExbD [Nannocystis sp.]MBK7827863.1 biopolymer transporter ExbD [Nannocystis sp.]